MSAVEIDNLLTALPDASAAEQVSLLHRLDGVRIERIVSQGQATPPDTWYDQDESEWVLLLQGAATIRFEGEATARDLRPGDHLLIPPHARHRVEWTDPAQPTVWLAVHVAAGWVAGTT